MGIIKKLIIYNQKICDFMNIKNKFLNILNTFIKRRNIQKPFFINGYFYPQTIVFHQINSIILEDTATTSTIDKLYNDGGILKFDSIAATMLNRALIFSPTY